MKTSLTALILMALLTAPQMNMASTEGDLQACLRKCNVAFVEDVDACFLAFLSRLLLICKPNLKVVKKPASIWLFKQCVLTETLAFQVCVDEHEDIQQKCVSACAGEP